MATSCPIGLDVDQLRREVSLIYARVAEDPRATHSSFLSSRAPLTW